MIKHLLLSFFILFCLLGSMSCSKKNTNTSDTNGVAAFDKPASNQGLGFYAADTFKNTKMLDVQAAIMKLIVPTGVATPVATVLTFKYNTLAEAYKTLKAKKNRLLFDDLVALQIHRCILKNDEVCAIQSQYQQFSGFFINQGQQMMTSFQVVSLLMAHKSSQASSLTADLALAGDFDFLAYDRFNNVLIDEVSPAHLHSVEQQQTFPSSSKYPDLALTDALTVWDLTKTRNTSLAEANTSISSGDTIYTVGFPNATTDRSALGFGDSNGRDVFFAHGYVDTLEGSFTAFGLNWTQTPDVVRLIHSALDLSMRIDATREMIGGPIVNERGEYVGVISRTTSDLQNKFTVGLQIPMK